MPGAYFDRSEEAACSELLDAKSTLVQQHF
jgi:hypothetical protein